MKTAEVAIEHVLTGILALCAFVLPFLSWLNFNGTLFKGGNTLVPLGQPICLELF